MSDPGGSPAGNGGQFESGKCGRLSRAGSLQSTGGVRKRRVHFQTVKRNLGPASMLRLRDLQSVRHIISQYVLVAFPIHRGRDPLCVEPGSSEGNCESHRSDQLSESARDGAGTGFDRDICRWFGGIKKDPNRINFDPYPWHSMAIWILTQMKRWGHLKGDVTYASVAQEVYRAADCDKIERELGYPAHTATMAKHLIMGKEFDPSRPDADVGSFKIHSMASPRERQTLLRGIVEQEKGMRS